MKLQNLSIIFIIIIMPITLILSAYNRMQIKSLEMQTYYDSKLTEAAYDAIKAYNINIRNNLYEKRNLAKKRDIEASNQAFITSLTTGLGIGGYGEDYIKPYIPAIIYTLYDGFYAYAPTKNEKSGKYEHILKPYITYSARYQNGSTDVVVSYTLDNYITVIGKIGSEFVNKSGYLINNDLSVTKEILKENLLIDEREEEYIYVYSSNDIRNEVGQKRYYEPILDKWFFYRPKDLSSGSPKIYSPEEIDIEDSNAVRYADDSKEFTDWVNDKLSNIKMEDMIIAGKSYTQLINEYGIYSGSDKGKPIFASSNNMFEDEDSTFNMHKKDVIKVIILEELRTSIANYNKHSGALDVNYNFKVPILTDEEWNTITTNISITAFMQGLSIGFKTYNSYVTVTNTENFDYSTKNNLCFINLDEENSQYHFIDCPKLTGENIIGYRKVDFETNSIEINNEEIKYYYKHKNLPCYNCIVNRNYDKVPELTPAKQQALNNALARERNMLHY